MPRLGDLWTFKNKGTEKGSTPLPHFWASLGWFSLILPGRVLNVRSVHCHPCTRLDLPWGKRCRCAPSCGINLELSVFVPTLLLPPSLEILLHTKLFFRVREWTIFIATWLVPDQLWLRTRVSVNFCTKDFMLLHFERCPIPRAKPFLSYIFIVNEKLLYKERNHRWKRIIITISSFSQEQFTVNILDKFLEYVFLVVFLQTVANLQSCCI